MTKKCDEERLLKSYDVERRSVVVEDVSGFTDRITRVFLQSPTFVREIAMLLFRLALKIEPLRRRMLRRLAKLDRC